MRATRRVGNRIQRDNWRKISRILRSEALLKCVELHGCARIAVEPISWERYWGEISCRIPFDVGACLDALRSARLRYIQNGFGLRDAIPYCHAYYWLLRSSLDLLEKGQADFEFLWAVLGLECAAVRWANRPDVHVAVTWSVRNPTYLLAKIREPQARGSTGNRRPATASPTT